MIIRLGGDLGREELDEVRLGHQRDVVERRGQLLEAAVVIVPAGVWKRNLRAFSGGLVSSLPARPGESRSSMVYG
ncbi:hypothetical protein [Krasilnikovia sp. M28-CT-15]|uniref:hypothetical protein n=1 Tax=Krasilnikovia sp. M28-CT-15 TaxID=3373540 RepID=UPI00399C79A3